MVIDASAILAFIGREPGWDRIEPHLPDSLVSSVNVAEVLSKMSDRGVDDSTSRFAVAALGLEERAFGAAQALASGALRAPTRAAGLSLGDRACLALAGEEGLPALTTDREWGRLAIDIRVELVR